MTDYLTESRRATHGSKIWRALIAGGKKTRDGGVVACLADKEEEEDDKLPASQPFFAFLARLRRFQFFIIASRDSRPPLAKLFLKSLHKNCL